MGYLKKLKLWYAKWRKEKLPHSERGYVLHPQMKERTDGRLVTYDRLIRCEVPAPDNSEDFCVNALPVGEECNDHWCLRSDYRGRIYRYRWENELAENLSEV